MFTGAIDMRFVLKSGTFAPIVFSLVLVFGLIISLLVIPPASADELYGRIRGIVSDSSGSALPGAELRLTNEGTGTSQNLQSDADGSFIFINLRPGNYSLTATKGSFKTFQVKGIKVEPNQIYVQGVVMELGSRDRGSGVRGQGCRSAS